MTRAAAGPPHLQPRTVSWRNALRWYEDALRLVKRAPFTWAMLAVLTLAAELLLQVVPDFGPMLAKLVVPLVACGMLYAAEAIDRGGTPTVGCAFTAFTAAPAAIATIIATSLLSFAAEEAAGWWIADANLLAVDANDDLTMAAIMGIYAIGILASLPLTFVPFHLLFERVAPGAAIVASWRGFIGNTAPLLVYAAASLVLLGFGIATMGLGLVFALPLWAASSYAAWKDIFGVVEAAAD